MQRVRQPTKEQVRQYMLMREAEKQPPPAPEEIRRRLGWELAERHDCTALENRTVGLFDKIGELVSLVIIRWIFLNEQVQDGQAWRQDDKLH